jgi:4'-phosphopantetheinyl transferase
MWSIAWNANPSATAFARRARVATPGIFASFRTGVVPVEMIGSGVAVHVLAHREPVEAEDVAQLARYLDNDEHARRFCFQGDRNAFVLAHAFLRRVLSRYARVAPESWLFVRGPWGKPRIAPQFETSLSFNLSHTKGCIVCAVTSGREVGIDVERVDSTVDLMALAERFFAPVEVASMAALPGEQQSRRFYQLWTLKEAYLKARGLGLSLPVDRIAFTVGAGKPTLATDAGLDDSDWQFDQFAPTEEHLIAVAVPGREIPVWTVRS